MDIIVKRRGGFTLAEVLITLSIIGVVAALTIPGLVVKNQEKEAVVRLKKAYNVFSNAFSLAKIEYGDPSGWGWTGEKTAEGSNNAMDALSPFLNIMKRCNQDTGCFKADYMYKALNGTDWRKVDAPGGNQASKAILADGMNFYIVSAAQSCNANYGIGKLSEACGYLTIDVNGQKNPNVLGRDIFTFYITRGGFVPSGLDGDIYRSLKEYCGTGSVGVSCAAWVLSRENMNYPALGVGWD